MIDKFDGEYRFLSNFYESPIFYKGYQYKSGEHAFQAAKAKDFVDRNHVACASTPGEAKRRGRLIQLREDWESIKDKTMYEIVHNKFFQNKVIAKQLMDTGTEELIEGNTWGDRYWGIDGTGLNKLGKTLMRVREELNKYYTKES